MLALVQAARRHLPVAILSNTTSALPADLRLDGLSSAFDAVFPSAELGVAKPALVAYQAVAAAVNIQPGRMFFTDDEMIYVQGAGHTGVPAEQFTSAVEFHATLTRLGLPVTSQARNAA